LNFLSFFANKAGAYQFGWCWHFIVDPCYHL
jgi:hypothetical protein